MAYGTGGVFKRRDTYWVHYSIHGRVIRESAHTTSRDEALVFLTQRRFATGTTLAAPRPDQQTVAMLCARVLTRYTTRKQASVATARGHAKAWLAALGGDTPLEALCVETLTPILEGWEGEDYRAATLNRRLSFLRVGLRLLGRRTQLDFAELRYPEENTRDGYLSRGDFDRLYAAAVAFDPDLAEFFAWLYVTGMRKGEARQLTVAMVDRRRDTWTLRIPGRVQKHRKDRGLQLSGILRTLVAARLAKQTRGCEFLFHRAGEPIREFKHAWKTLVATAGLVDVRPHDLRRSAVTNMLEAGFSIAQVMAITGHRTAAMVLRYAQVVDAHLDEKFAALATPSCLTGTAA
jgi:integrase